MRKLILAALVLTGGCNSLNLSNTVAGGACGDVDYNVTVMGAPILGIKAGRECIPDATETTTTTTAKTE